MSIEEGLICRQCGCLLEDCECEPDESAHDFGYDDMGETDYDGDG